MDLRKKGLSYSEIRKKVKVPLSTLSVWLQNVSLTDAQKKVLLERRSEKAKANIEKIKLKTKRLIEDVHRISEDDIEQISRRELWFMGIMLYWKERLLLENKSDMSLGVRFSSSDPYLIRFFLKWLQEIGNIQDKDIILDLFIGARQGEKIKEAKRYWHDVTTFPIASFSHVYYQKSLRHMGNKNNKRKRKTNANKTQFGFIRIRVRASSMLARQISGWSRGIVRYYWKDN